MRIVCDHIAKSFQTKDGLLPVLGDISCATEEHDFVCLLGPNGCGKSTLLKIIAGVLAPCSGKVIFKETNGALRPASLIFQEYGLFPWLSVKDNVCFYLEMKGVSRRDRYAKAQPLIDQMGLSRFVNYYPHQLSLGMKQKVNLIRGLLMDSEAILIDEADRSLDVYSKLVAHKDIRRVWEEFRKTIVYVTHDIDSALSLARTVWIMGDSPARIIRTFTVKDFLIPSATAPGGRVPDPRLKDQIIAIIEKEAQGMRI